MKPITKALLLAAVCALGACTNANRFETAGGAPDGAAGESAGLTDPGAVETSSISYFQSTVGDRVLFRVDESTLNPESRTVLDGQARWLQQNPGFQVTIEGHADEQGTREYNLALSARRASAVQNYLIQQGVSPSRLRTVPFGKERPIEVCSEEACYAKNRRAVTVLNSAGTS